MTLDQIDMRLDELQQYFGKIRRRYNHGKQAVQESADFAAGIPGDYDPVIQAINDLPSGTGTNDHRKARLAEYTDIYSALNPVVSGAASGLPELDGV